MWAGVVVCRSRRKVLDLVEAGRWVADVALALGISAESVVVNRLVQLRVSCCAGQNADSRWASSVGPSQVGGGMIRRMVSSGWAESCPSPSWKAAR